MCHNETMRWLKWGLVGFLTYLTWKVGRGEDFLILSGFNLLMHEAGHLIFNLGGETLGFLGGTLMQLLIPIICAGVLIREQRDWFGVLVCGWWWGENGVNVGRYMKDAQSQLLPLIGGEHDWAHLFTKWDMLERAEALGKGMIDLSIMVMISMVLGMVVQVIIERRQLI